MKTVCFGEILLRLSSPAGQLLLQSPTLDTCIGGAEANVAVCLSRLGHDTAMVSALPDNALGHAARDAVRAHGVDTRAVRFSPGRMGLYFLTPGAVMRPSDIIYDRAASVFAQTAPAAYDWPALLQGASWLHISGVSPAVGPQAAEATLAAVRAARTLNIRVSYDGNYRASLWAQQGNDGADVLRELMAHADLAFVDQRDVALVLRRPELAQDRAAAMQAAFAAFPQLQRVAATVRVQHSVDNHALSATLFTRIGVLASRSYEVHAIVDRIGTGDAFAAGVLHGLQSSWDDALALDFGLAAAVLKHSLEGDFCPASEAQVKAIMAGGLDVRR
ncbi:sugar kinase [Pseudoduganella sp. RAF53_2]|uniref:sugar kinase n=1 Tax=unclassified Pseudoduganella TaxID=2637179 RepID=UPI003F99CA1E